MPLKDAYTTLSGAHFKDHQKAVIIITDGYTMSDQALKQELLGLKKDILTFVYFIGGHKRDDLEGLTDHFISEGGDVGTSLSQYFGAVAQAYNSQQVLSCIAAKEVVMHNNLNLPSRIYSRDLHLHGSAQWADKNHLRKRHYGEDGNIFLGYGLPEHNKARSFPITTKTQKHLLTVGPTRSGKLLTSSLPRCMEHARLLGCHRCKRRRTCNHCSALSCTGFGS